MLSHLISYDGLCKHEQWTINAFDTTFRWMISGLPGQVIRLTWLTFMLEEGPGITSHWRQWNKSKRNGDGVTCCKCDDGTDGRTDSLYMLVCGVAIYSGIQKNSTTDCSDWKILDILLDKSRILRHPVPKPGNIWKKKFLFLIAFVVRLTAAIILSR